MSLLSTEMVLYNEDGGMISFDLSSKQLSVVSMALGIRINTDHLSMYTDEDLNEVYQLLRKNIKL